jgi:ABC-2 type transport system permease protein
MKRALVLKLLRDVRTGLIVMALLLGGFQCLWAKVTSRISGDLVSFVRPRIPLPVLEKVLFSGPGKLVRTFMGGEDIRIERAMDILTIGFVHPLVQTILCVWAIGRAAGAIAGELDRGTLELLLAQPVPRYRFILSQLGVDMITIPILCLTMWGGVWLGTWLVSPIEVAPPEPTEAMPPTLVPVGPFTIPLEVLQKAEGSQEGESSDRLNMEPAVFGPALLAVASLLFAVSGYTLWLSARGRFRGRVLGLAVVATLLQFLVNVVGQLWDAVSWLRPFTVFYYYQPQQIILQHRWLIDLGDVWNGGRPLFAVPGAVVLLVVGVVGYLGALVVFCRRDLPAPL